MNSKILVFIIFFLIFLTCNYNIVVASPTNQIIIEGLNKVDTFEIEKYWDELVNEYGGFFPDNQKVLFDLILPTNSFDIQSFLLGLLKYFFYEILYNSKLIGTIIMLTIFSVLLQHIQGAFENSTVSKIAFYVSYMVLIIIAINSFSVAINLAKDAIQSMINLMIALIPLVLSLLASSGNIVSATLFHPLIIFLINIIGTIIYKVVFPLIFLSSLLYIVSSISDKYQVTQMAKLLRNVSIGLLGVLLTIFLGVVSVKGASASIADGITIRTAKYITSNFVPVVGKMFADASDTVIGASLLVKNAVGLAGVFILLVIVIFPSIKILALAFIYNFSASIMQPLGNNPITETLSVIGKNLIFIFAALASVSLMFYLAITIIIAASNISAMIQ
ncbi:MAG: stage III sporulation protein AE [Vulcanibacillus sp.]